MPQVTNIIKLEADLENLNELIELFGSNDKNLKLLKRLYKVNIYSNNRDIMVDTEEEFIIQSLKKMFYILIQLIRNNVNFNDRDIIYIKNLLSNNEVEAILSLFINRVEIIKTFNGLPIYPKTLNQLRYIESIEKNVMVFGIGPAGTGKTYLAVLSALKKLKENSIKRIILTRPAVEAGESLGFLPGDLKEKVDPYLRPLYDAMYDILGVKQTTEYIEKGIIEIAPLAYMRGRTLDNAYVILDEAQNTTINQMKLFLTRLGFGSKMIVTGDITQSDLPKRMVSGLVKAGEILQNIDTVEILYFNDSDVVRHPLVQTIIKRFEND
ncbi:MAG: phosphate starvation-inducible protein PhoH [Tenericutes bacterium 4572_104]|nr:MAG: phosphate starvation-inducible protein PhoH [Tenericutes bacterium 4572_104]